MTGMALLGFGMVNEFQNENRKMTNVLDRVSDKVNNMEKNINEYGILKAACPTTTPPIIKKK